MKIKQKTLLRKILHKENYDTIIFWEKKRENRENILIWDTVTSSFQYSIDFDGSRVYPYAKISRYSFYNVTYKQINEKLKGIESEQTFEEFLDENY